jgi:hypothetical protein
MLPLVMDAVVAGLLVATIVFAIKLNGRLAALRADSERLQGLIKGLQGASGAAEDAVAALKMTSGDAGRVLQNTIDEAKKLNADLQFLTDRAGDLANRLETGIRTQRDQAPGSATVGGTGLSASQQAAATAAAAAEARGSQSRLAMLLKQAEAADAAPQGRVEPSLGTPRAKARPSAQTRETREEPPRPAGEPREAPSREAPRAAEPQSRAERDLLRALEARSRQ